MFLAFAALRQTSTQAYPQSGSSSLQEAPKEIQNLKKEIDKLQDCQKEYTSNLFIEAHLHRVSSYYEIEQTYEAAKTAGPSNIDDDEEKFPEKIFKHPNLKDAVDQSTQICKDLINTQDFRRDGMTAITKPIEQLLQE